MLDPGVTDVLAAWDIPEELIELVDAGKRREVNEAWAEAMRGASPEQRLTLAKRSEIFRAPDAYTLIKDLQAYCRRGRAVPLRADGAAAARRGRLRLVGDDAARLTSGRASFSRIAT